MCSKGTGVLVFGVVSQVFRPVQLTCGNVAKASPRAAHTERGSPNGCAVSRGCNGFRLAKLLLASNFELNLRVVDPNYTGGNV